jgi:UDP-N-acetylglucosamine 2-epimerase (non-hydrolysing)
VTSPASTAFAVHVAATRAAAVRLAPVVTALAERGVPQVVLDPAGACVAATAPGPPDTLAPAASTSALVLSLERLLAHAPPALVLLAGDDDATLACALVASRAGAGIARLGGGLRCGDRTVRSEIARHALDELAGLLLVDGEDAAEQLRSEGVDPDRVRCVGSTVPDTVGRWIASARAASTAESRGLQEGAYVLATLHRPEGAAEDMRLARAAESLSLLARDRDIVLCPHPRAAALLDLMGDIRRLRTAGVTVVGPLDYLGFLSLEAAAAAVVTDAATVQEETTVLGVPCFTLARSSERALTLTYGTNALAGEEPEDLAALIATAEQPPAGGIPLWDGAAGERAASALLEWKSR